MRFSVVALLPLLASTFSLTSATSRKPDTNWGCSSSGAPKSQSSLCKARDSFYIPFQDTPVCVSDQTRTTPKQYECPINWYKHKSYDCCVPNKVVSPCDCREGYKFNKKTWKCEKNTGNNKCRGDQWWHDRSKTCCDKGWEHNPPRGSCPQTKWCPNGWFWHKDYKKCRPQTPHSPEPDCDEWDEGNQCCHSGPTKSPAPPTSSQKPHGNRGKRSYVKKRTQSALDPSESDKMYCPPGLHVCPISGAIDEWSWECLSIRLDLENCGGCASLGEGKDCTTIVMAGSVGCEQGICAVYSCKSGFKPSLDGSSCVAA